jgi:antitoxin component of MazEF toxin-antitoxin module
MHKVICEIVDVGNSLGVRLPSKQLKNNNIKKGDSIEILYKKIELELSTKKYVVAKLDNKRVIVDLREQDELSVLNVGLVNIVDYIRHYAEETDNEYILTRKQYLKILVEWQ